MAHKDIQYALRVPCEAPRAAGVWWGPLYWGIVFYTADRPVSPSLSVSLPFHLSHLLLLRYQFQRCKQGPDPAEEVESSGKSDKNKRNTSIPRYTKLKIIQMSQWTYYLCTLPDLVKQHLRPLRQRPLHDRHRNKLWGHHLTKSHLRQVMFNHVHQGRVCK